MERGCSLNAIFSRALVTRCFNADNYPRSPSKPPVAGSNPAGCASGIVEDSGSELGGRDKRRDIREGAISLLLELREHRVIAPERVEAFAKEWLSVTCGELALRVLGGGEFVAARFVELCRHVLRATDEDEGRGVGRGA